MTHAALIEGVLFVFVVMMVLLLVSYITAVIVSPPRRPGSHARQRHHAAARPPPLPPRAPLATAPPPPLRRRPPPVTPQAAGFHGRAVRGDATEPGEREEMLYGQIPRPQVSGGPPWGPAPKPPGLDR